MGKEAEIIDYCATCGGPIFSGEPVSLGRDCISHRFQTWCNYYKNQDAEFAKDCGIDYKEE